MMFVTELAWLAAGVALGAVLGGFFSHARNKTKAQRAKLALADSQQRRALERLSETNRALRDQIEAASNRQGHTLESLKKLHATEVKALQAELALLRQQLLACPISEGEDRSASPTSFATTQFSDTHR